MKTVSLFIARVERKVDVVKVDVEPQLRLQAPPRLQPPWAAAVGLAEGSGTLSALPTAFVLAAHPAALGLAEVSGTLSTLRTACVLAALPATVRVAETTP